MTSRSILSVLIVALVALSRTTQAFAPRSFGVTTKTHLAAEDKRAEGFVERGVSVDQDGKSNVWAIEPKMEVSTKSSDEKTQSVLIAAGGLGVAAVAAALILTNLPDPNQF